MSGLNRRACAAGIIAVAAASAAGREQPGGAGPLAGAIGRARARVVKLYGGRLGGAEGYGSGVLVSAEGRIVTTLSTLLEARRLRVVLDDGRRFAARVLARDQRRQLALLGIDAFGLPHFELGSSAHLRPGDWLVAAANPFKVADGPEPVSIAVGVFSGRTALRARRGAQDFPYRGPVLLTDIIVAVPGSAGGALVDAEGNLVGLIGKPVLSQRTNTWLNYALPVEQVAAFVSGAAGSSPGTATAPARKLTPADLGIRLFEFGSREPAPYIERVRPGSPAWRVGLRADDLILSVAGRRVKSCAGLRQALADARPSEPVALVIKRGERVETVELRLAERLP